MGPWRPGPHRAPNAPGLAPRALQQAEALHPCPGSHADTPALGERRTPWGSPGPLKADPGTQGTLGDAVSGGALANSIPKKPKNLQKVNI